jgi:hypothetical protein
VRQVRTSTGEILVISPVSGSAIQAAISGILDPEVPKFFIVAQNRWTENPHHPDYIEAQRKAASDRADAALRCVVRGGVKLKTKLDLGGLWLRQAIRYHDQMLEGLDVHSPEDMAYFYIMREAIGNSDDINLLTKNACLTDEAVTDYMHSIGVTRNGMEIDKAGLKHRLDTGIGHRVLTIGNLALVHPTEEYSACTGSGLSWWEWRNGKFDLDFMVETVAHHRTQRLMDSHAKDAEASEVERQHRKAARK